MDFHIKSKIQDFLYIENIDKTNIILVVITFYIENIKIVYERFVKTLLHIQFV